jgi:hypothetical protein
MSVLRRFAQIAFLISAFFYLSPVGAVAAAGDPTCDEYWYDLGWVDSQACDCQAQGCWPDECIQWDLHDPHCPTEDCTRNDFCAIAEAECQDYCWINFNHQVQFSGCFLPQFCSFVCGCAP